MWYGYPSAQFNIYIFTHGLSSFAIFNQNGHVQLLQFVRYLRDGCVIPRLADYKLFEDSPSIQAIVVSNRLDRPLAAKRCSASDTPFSRHAPFLLSAGRTKAWVFGDQSESTSSYRARVQQGSRDATTAQVHLNPRPRMTRNHILKFL